MVPRLRGDDGSGEWIIRKRYDTRRARGHGRADEMMRSGGSPLPQGERECAERAAPHCIFAIAPGTIPYEDWKCWVTRGSDLPVRPKRSGPWAAAGAERSQVHMNRGGTNRTAI